MKLGFITAICDGMTFEEVVDFAASHDLECLEVACWPRGKAQRRYAGVSHIDVAEMNEEKAAYLTAYCQKRGVEISSLAYYPNTLDPDPEKRASYIKHLYKLIDASAMLGVNMVTTFVGRDPKKTVSENLETVKEVWPPIVKYAEEKGVKIAIENCLRSWTVPTLGSIMIPPILCGSRLIISSQSMNSGIRSSMCTTRISKYMRISWQMWGPWPCP